jgi:hypothetical protein
VKGYNSENTIITFYCNSKMTVQLVMSDCLAFDDLEPPIDIIDRARTAGMIREYSPRSNRRLALRYEYLLIRDLNQLLKSQGIKKPHEIEGWTYDTKKIDGRTQRVYYRNV